MVSVKTITLVLTALVFACRVSEVQAQVAVIINKANRIEDLELGDVKDIYQGDMVSWLDNKRIFAVTQRSENEVSRFFYEIAVGKKIEQVKRLWIKISLSGKAAPPKTLASDGEVLEYIASNEGAIGFVDFKTVNRDVKVLKINGKEPWESDYVLKR